ncbi:hypothetical protein HNR42_002666 [Deinobacterium chartae]|uniref:Sensory transduction regulator n=1 Tax=Deinobacterium chartae TaxID=521158 RepID=A0A841I4A2_9DEIO|nr:YbjN domain-containing protein [Deinobacterium chartae]MBB6099228.1 hypothetical protein [Deinobacterium chartae]
MTFTEIADYLEQRGWEPNLEDGTLSLDLRSSSVASGVVSVSTEALEGGGMLLRFDLQLDLYVGEDLMAEVMMGVNLLNRQLKVGTLYLEVGDEREDEDPDQEIFFVLGARGGVLLASLDADQLPLIERALRTFEEEISAALDSSLEVKQAIKA